MGLDKGTACLDLKAIKCNWMDLSYYSSNYSVQEILPALTDIWAALCLKEFSLLVWGEFLEI